jgi:hypothetical protein
MKRRQISQEVLDHLPSDLHRLVAEECFIRTRQWELTGPSNEEPRQIQIPILVGGSQTVFVTTSSAACQEQHSL